uniref:LAGLIDADG endonuclease n=1 Tax=Fusarium oxysporum f. sp. cucumerinum TaxID=5508 RepID=A0A2C8D3S8_FUSOX|nr:TPA: LAGLIDADG endonuclease [Fusarium oxysporum f. sp. cucumerinum]SNU77078.1 TPA: LAGLIDADG endonuclease [Fusarium oxysporum f. sp. cucumerinum]SNU77107.1 TPA: LAGLIDADG endonuclease [Fusarium oxysporum f. sp. cucumerinum]
MKFIVVQVHDFLMKRWLLAKKGMISLSTLGTKGANCLSQNWNIFNLDIRTPTNLLIKGRREDINSRCYLSSVASLRPASEISTLHYKNPSSLTLRKLSLSAAQAKARYEYNFIEWFRGFTDAEGCFLIVKQGKSFAFRFIIKIHKDDIDLLYFIKNSLGGIGNVGTEENLAHFKVTSISEIKTIIEIFTTHPLNSSKHLDFLGFSAAYRLYTTNQENRDEVLQEISSIKESMNSKRTDYKEPLAHILDGNQHKIHITDNWLVGFIEGDGSFSITKKDFILTFSISQKGNLELMKAIQSYLLNIAEAAQAKARSCLGASSSNTLAEEYTSLASSKYGTQTRSVIYITKSKNKYTNLSDATKYNYVLIVKSKEFVNNVLIPYLNSLTFHSKKELDYSDWKSIGQLKNLGLHYLPEGKKLIELILSQMNNNRLSNSGNKIIDRNYIASEVNRLLNGPSNYEIIKGRIFIKSLNKFYTGRLKIQVELHDQEGSVFKTFDSMNKCADFLGISTHTVSKRMKTSLPVILNNKEYNVVKSFGRKLVI